MKNGIDLRVAVESCGNNPHIAVGRFVKALDEGEVQAKDFSLREMAEVLVSRDNWQEAMERYNRTGAESMSIHGETIDVSAFNALTGQLAFNQMRVGWDLAPSLIQDLFETYSTKVPTDERIPGIGLPSRYGYDIHAGMPIPQSDFGQHYLTGPELKKSALLCDVTYEAVHFDRTNDVMQRAQNVGLQLRKNKERRCCASLAGVTVTLDGKSFAGNNHSWNGTAYNTYSTSVNAIGANAVSGLPMVDEDSIETLYLLSTNMLHPDTGQRLSILQDLDTVVCMPYKLKTATEIFGASQIRRGTQSAALQMYAPKGIPQYNVVASQDLYSTVIDSGVSATNARDWWFLISKNNAFKYFETKPLEIQQAPAMGDLAFTNDLVLRMRGIEFGQPYAYSPRHTYWGYNA